MKKSPIIIPVAALTAAFGLGVAYNVSKSEAQTKGTNLTIEQPQPSSGVTSSTSITPTPTTPASQPASAKQSRVTPTNTTPSQTANETTVEAPTSLPEPAPTATPNPLANPVTGAPPGYYYDSNGNLQPAGKGGIYP